MNIKSKEVILKVGQAEAVPSGLWWRLGISLVMAGQAMVFGLGINLTPPAAFSIGYWVVHGLLLASSLVVIGLLGPRLLKETWKAVSCGQVTVEAMFFLSAFGALVASLVSTIRGEGPVFYEVVAIVLSIYTLGKTVGIQAKDKVWAQVRKLREAAGKARVMDIDGSTHERALKDVKPGHVVVVEPGQMITVDGLVLEGSAYIAEAAMTGEPAPVPHRTGDAVLAGTYSLDGRLLIEVQKSLGDRLLDDVLKVVEGASIKPSRLQEQANQLMQGFIPLVMCISLATFGIWQLYVEWPTALFHSMAVLLVACPCALGLATPIAVWSALWNLATRGLVIKTGVFLDVLAYATTFVFDKTGTLSESTLHIAAWSCEGAWQDRQSELRTLVCALEAGLDHPIGRAFKGLEAAAGAKIISRKWVAGGGVEGEVLLSGVSYLLRVGDLAWLGRTQPRQCKWVGVEVNGIYAATLALEEALRADTELALQSLKAQGIRLAILTGDKTPLWKQVCGADVQAALSPSDKAEWVASWKCSGETVVFVGDGLNDAAAMAEASASVAMNGGAALAVSSAEAVLMGESLAPLVLAVQVARRVQASVRSNIIIAIGYNFIGVALAAGGYLHPVVAALIMGASSLVVAFRALRAARLDR